MEVEMTCINTKNNQDQQVESIQVKRKPSAMVCGICLK